MDDSIEMKCGGSLNGVVGAGWKFAGSLQTNGLFTLLDTDIGTDSDSDSKPYGYILLHTMHTLHGL